MTEERAPSDTLSGSALTIAWYGDDFTGATDTLATLAQAGMRAMLFMGVPTPEQLAAAGSLDGVGIAGAARAMSPSQIRDELRSVGRFFAELSPPVLHYKVCSTFDSSETSGNIYTAIQSLLPFVDSTFVPVVGGQPNLARYCAFSNLFAKAGAQGEICRIDRHPTMSRHPVTPMSEADLRMHFSRLGLLQMGAVHLPVYSMTPQAQDEQLQTLLDKLAESDEDLQAVIFDLTDASQLAAVGRQIWDKAQERRLLAVGPSSVVQVLAAHLRKLAPDVFASSSSSLLPAQGPVFVFAGSLSPVTARQIEHADDYLRMPIDAQRLLSEGDYRNRCLDEIVSQLVAGRHTLAYTGGSERAPFNTSSAALVSRISADLVAGVVGRMASIEPLKRLGVAGGDTSSQVTRALDLWGLSYQCNVSAGVTLCRTHSSAPALNGLELMLKGGQVGSDDLFSRFANGF